MNNVSNATPIYIYCEPDFYFTKQRVMIESISSTGKYYQVHYWCYTWQRLDGDVTYP